MLPTLTLEQSELRVRLTVQGGLARFINHSCNPNCVTSIVTSADGRKHIVITAKRDIAPGEELFYDYKLEFEPDEPAIPCLCGASNCRKRMN
jgi:SET domain-containing protein